MRANAVLSYGLGAALSGCTLLIPGVAPHDVARDAARQERARCGPDAVDPRIFDASIVESVTPLYRYVMGGPNGREARLLGAELHVRPLPGVTAELLTRGLMCRGAQLVLGHAAPASSEPYFLPDGWLSVDVRSDQGSFVVSLTAEDPDRGKEILARARAFVEPRAPDAHEPRAAGP